MKKNILNLLFLFVLITGYSQNQYEILNYYSAKTAIDSIGEALADVALQNPALRSMEADAKASEYTWKASRYSFLNDLSVSGNLNEYSLKGLNNNSNNGNLLYPRYNVGVRVGLGEFFTTDKTAKANFYRYQSETERLKDGRQKIRMQVKTNYQDYAMTQKLMALQQEILQDQLIAFSKIEEKFKNGELSLDVYTRESRTYNAEQVKEVTLTRDLKVTQAALEALIGMPLEDAFNQIKVTNINNRR